MNIAVFIKKTTFHKGYGGLETQNKILCEGLAKRGHQVTVFSPNYELSGEKEENGVKYIFVNSVFRSLAGFSKFQKNNWEVRSVEEFKKANNERKFDLVLGQSSAALGFIKNKDKFDIPVISISHGTISGEYKTLIQSLKSPKDFLMLIPNTGYLLLNFFYRQREFVRHSNKVIAVSNKVKEALIDETFVDERKIEVIYNGINPPQITPFANRQNTVIYVGLIHSSKGIDDLLLIAPKVNANFKIVGDGPHLEVFRNLSSDVPNVEFTGKVKYEDVLGLMSEAKVFVLPSKRVEGFPMTLVEAMFAKLPIVGSNMGGIPEAIDHEITGYIYESGDVNSLFKYVSTLIESTDLASQMGQKGYEKAKQEFTVDVMLDKYIKVMKEVIS